MKRTVNEKEQYNREKKTAFSYGYVWGVQAYRKYPKANKAEQKRLLAQIDDYKETALHGKGKARECAKGYMCAVRDCAEERKAKQKRG